MSTIKILKTESFTDNAEVVSIYGQGCSYETKKGVDGFQIDFDIEVTNDKEEIQEFHVVYQSMERSCNMMAYNGVEMSTAKMYGCDSDESRQAIEFCDDDDNALVELEEIATKLCREWLDNNK